MEEKLKKELETTEVNVEDISGTSMRLEGTI